MLDVLWLTPVPPDRNGGGGHIRQAYLLLALAEKARVHLVSCQHVRDTAVRSAVASLNEFDIGPIDWAAHPTWIRRIHDLWTALVKHEPLELADNRRARALLSTAPVWISADIVVVEYAALAPLAAGSPERSGRWVLTMHNVGSMMADQLGAIDPGRRQRWIHHRDAVNWRRWEKAVVENFDGIITVSEDDARVFGGPNDFVKVIPNGVDTGRYLPTEPPDGAKLIFTGALYTLPNIDGLTWFCTSVLPHVRRRHPEVTLAIVGSHPIPRAQQLASMDGVTVHADVDDVAPYLAEARVAIVPLRIGTGTRLKALEAMAAGRPVVGTTIGLSGLGLENGRDAVFADDPQQFANAVSRAITDDAWIRSLVSEGRRLVERRYSWARIAETFVDEVLAPS